MTRSVNYSVDVGRTHWSWHLLFLSAGLLVIAAFSMNVLVERWFSSDGHWFSSDGHISDEGIDYLNLFRSGLLVLAGGCVILWTLRKIITRDFREAFDRWKRVPYRLDISAVVPSTRPVGLKLVLWLLIPLWIAGVTICLVPSYDQAQAWAYFLTYENGVYETLAVVCYIFAGIVSLRFAIPYLRRNSKRGLLRWWLLGLAAVCLFVAAEETNWGELYFHYESAEFIRQSNYQNEVSLHNVELPFFDNYWANDLAHIAAVCGGILLPLMICSSMYFRRLIWAIETPLPPWLSQAYFLIAALIPQDNILNLSKANIPSELREATIAFGVAIWLWCVMQEQLKGHQ